LNISIPLVAHYWSLGVEEQFYLFFPWLVKKISRLPIVFVGGAVLLTAIKIAFRFWDPTGLPFRILDVTRFQCMLIGAAGAWFYYAGNARFTKLTTNKVVQAASWGCLALITLNSFNVASILDQELVSGVTVCIIMGQVTNRNWFSLERPIFDFLGTISYGIYVIHPLIIFVLARCFVWDMPKFVEYLVIYASAVGTTVAVAYLSYRFFEKPFLKQKNRFSTVRSQPSSEMATSVQPLNQISHYPPGC
jgi:peptidoglycan/LPS O-acetylase OafA/YrhL